MTIDPVCKMEVEEGNAEHNTEYNGKTYSFCGEGCKETFLAEPTKYAKGSDAEVAA